MRHLYNVASLMPSSIANRLMGRACGGIIFFKTTSFRSGVYRMTFILLRPNNNAF
jgi:hypothetical protein